LPLSKREKPTTPRRVASWMKYGFIGHVKRPSEVGHFHFLLHFSLLLKTRTVAVS
jgi:hypothetical protein